MTSPFQQPISGKPLTVETLDNIVAALDTMHPTNREDMIAALNMPLDEPEHVQEHFKSLLFNCLPETLCQALESELNFSLTSYSDVFSETTQKLFFGYYVAAIPKEEERDNLDKAKLVEVFNDNPSLALYLARKAVLPKSAQQREHLVLWNPQAGIMGVNDVRLTAAKDLAFFLDTVQEYARCFSSEHAGKNAGMYAELMRKDDMKLPHLPFVRAQAADVLLDALMCVAGTIGTSTQPLGDIGYLLEGAEGAVSEEFLQRAKQTTVSVYDKEEYMNVLRRLHAVWFAEEGFKAYMNAARKVTDVSHPEQEKIKALFYPFFRETPETVDEVSQWFASFYASKKFGALEAIALQNLSDLEHRFVLPSSRLPLYEQLFEILDLSLLINQETMDSFYVAPAIEFNHDRRASAGIQDMIKHALVLTAYLHSGQRANVLLQKTADVVKRAGLTSEAWQRVEAIYRDVLLDVQSARIHPDNLESALSSSLTRYERKLADREALASYAQKQELFSRMLLSDFIAKRDTHLARLVEIYSDEILEYGIASKGSNRIVRNMSASAARIQRVFAEQSEDTKDRYPVESLFDLYSFIDLNHALITGVVKCGGLSRDELSFFEQYVQQSSRFAVPFDITRLHEQGYHAGHRTGYYAVSIYVPLNGGDSPAYKEVKCFVKIFKDTRAKEHEEAMHSLAESLRNPVPRLLFSHENVILYEYADDKKIRDVFAEELA